MCMRPVEPPQTLAGNPGASRFVRGHRYRHPRHHRCRARDNAGANAVSARRGPAGRAKISGIGLRSAAGKPYAPGAYTGDRSSGCHGRSGCTGRPGHGNARTETSGQDDPYAPRRTEGAGRTRPKRATLLWHRLHRHGVGRGTVMSGLPATDTSLPRPPPSAWPLLYPERRRTDHSALHCREQIPFPGFASSVLLEQQPFVGVQQASLSRIFAVTSTAVSLDPTSRKNHGCVNFLG